ncbi:MAG: MATE family efflux transporter [Clostridia bacterium]|nr:MATE family efflux transporter [Clostridia bacterium]
MTQQSQIQTENKMGVMPVTKLLLTMALPMMLSMMVQALYNVVDSIFVSRISEDALTAISMAFPMQNLMIATAVGFGVGINALLSRALGQKDREMADRVAGQGILLEFLGYLVFLIIGLTAVNAYMRAQTDIVDIIEYGATYLRICVVGSFGLFAAITMERLLQSTGRTGYSMVVQLIGALFNIAFDPILIFGLFGLPKLGVAGAAYATIGGQIIAALAGIWLNTRKNPDVSVRVRNMKPDFGVIWSISKISIPSIAMASLGSIMTFFMDIILIGFTSTAVAVFGIYFKLQSFVFMPVFGLNNGMIPIVAYNYGANSPQRVKQTIKTAMVFAVFLMLCGLTVIQLMSDKLLLLFDASPEMLAIGVPALRLISIHFLFAGINIICISSCQAFGYSVYGLLISVVRQLLVLIPAAYLLSLTGVLNYVWLSFPIAETVTIFVCVFFLFRVLRKTGMISDEIGAVAVI